LTSAVNPRWAGLENSQPAALARVSAFQTVIAFAFGPVAFAAAGPAAALAGPRPVLAFGTVWAALGSAVVLAMPAVRAVTWQAPRGGERPGS
jgi:hypothetical protein